MSKTILYITNGITGSGGLERVVSIKASYFADHYNYSVHIITLNEGGKTPFYPLSDKVRIHDIAIHSNIIQYYRDYYNGIRIHINKINPDVIFVADDGLKGVLFPLIFKPKRKVIYERHTTKAIHGTGFKAKFTSKLMDMGSSRFDAFVVLTKSNKHDWPKANNLRVIPNPLPWECSNGKPIWDRKRIISVGSLSAVKGHDALIKAWANIEKDFPDYSLHIYGAPKDNYNNVKDLIDKLDLSDRAFIHNPTPNIKEKYMESALCVLPSRVEGFGMALIEAMSCGNPCISTNCEGPVDIVNDNHNGFIINVDDVNDMSKKIKLLLTQKDRLSGMSNNALDTASRYELSLIMQQWNKLII